MPIISQKDYIIAAAAFITAFAIALASTPSMRKLAFKLNVIDVPRDERRMHKTPVPLLGGIAIALAFIVCALIFANRSPQLFGILLGGALITALGALDDKFDIPAGWKLLAQFAIAAVPVLFGLRIDRINDVFRIFTEEGGRISLGILSVPLTMIWIVGLTNAVNFIDGLDGLACGVSFISGVSIFIISMKLGDANSAILIACLCGACLGFLPYNTNPAKIFMGDAGALFLGYTLATLSILGLFKWYSFVSFGIPFLVLAIPIFDIFFSIVRRILHGKNPMKADRGHVHQQLIDLGLNQKQVVAIFYCLSATLGLVSVLISGQNLFRQIIAIIIAVSALLLSLFLFLHREKTLRKKRLEEQAKNEENGSSPEDRG